MGNPVIRRGRAQRHVDMGAEGQQSLGNTSEPSLLVLASLLGGLTCSPSGSF